MQDKAENKILFVCPLPTYPQFSPLLKKLYCHFVRKNIFIFLWLKCTTWVLLNYSNACLQVVKCLSWKICAMYVKYLFIRFILAILTCTSHISGKIKANSYYTKLLKVNYIFFYKKAKYNILISLPTYTTKIKILGR